MTKVTTLAERLEKEQPSRELDAEIAQAFGWGVLEVNDPVTGHEFVWKKFGWHSRPTPPNFSSSLDTALALFRDVLPNWIIIHFFWSPGQFCNWAIQPAQSNLESEIVKSERADDHLAMALLAAVCRAVAK